MTPCQRFAESLHAYHDGELTGLSRWRLTRHLGQCGGCRQELSGISGVGAVLRDLEDDASGPDGLWESIALRLPAIDAQVADEGPRSGPLRALWTRSPRWLARPAAAGLVAACVAAAVIVNVWFTPAPDIYVVRSLDTRGTPVMVLPEEDGSTIIWVMDQDSDDAASGESGVVL